MFPLIGRHSKGSTPEKSRGYTCAPGAEVGGGETALSRDIPSGTGTGVCRKRVGGQGWPQPQKCPTGQESCSPEQRQDHWQTTHLGEPRSILARTDGQEPENRPTQQYGEWGRSVRIRRGSLEAVGWDARAGWSWARVGAQGTEALWRSEVRGA